MNFIFPFFILNKLNSCNNNIFVQCKSIDNTHIYLNIEKKNETYKELFL